VPRLLPLLLAAAVLLTPVCPLAAASPATAPAGETAMAAGAFLDTIGVNADPAGGQALAAQLRAAGIRHVRVRAPADPADPSWAGGVRALTAAGLGVDLVAASGTDWPAFAGVAAAVGGGLEALEVEAEGDAAALRLAARARPALARVPLLGPAADGATDVRTARLELHGRCPGCVPGGPLGAGPGTGTTGPPGAGPLQVTEATLGAGVPDAVAARYLPRLLLGHAQVAARTYLGALAGEPAGPGLLGPDGAPTPAYRDLANLAAVLADAGPAFTPGRLAFRLDGDTGGLRHLLLQKADGRFWLVLWVEAPSWDPAAGQELAVALRPVAVRLAEPVAAARAFAPDLGTTPERHFAGPIRSIELEVPDRPVLVELLPRTPPPAAGAQPPPRPARPPPTTPRRHAPPPTVVAEATADPDPAGGPASAAAAPASSARRPLAFTGAATLPLLLASGLLMLVGTAALAASRRRWHHHR
jgi:hypothetical protein